MYPQLILLLLSLNFCMGISCFADDDDDDKTKTASTLSPDIHHNLIDQKDHRDDVILPVTLAKVDSEVKSPRRQRVGKKRSRIMTCEADKYAENSEEELDESGEFKKNKPS